MRKISSLLIVGGLVGVPAHMLTAGTAAAAKCQTVGSGSTQITEDLARETAMSGLKDLLASSGMRPRGRVTMTCSTTLIVSTCNARQRACR